MITALLIGLLTSWVVDDLSYWRWLNYHINTDFFNHKPWNCSKCAAFWIGIVLTYPMYGGWEWLLLAPLSSSIAVLINQLKYMAFTGLLSICEEISVILGKGCISLKFSLVFFRSSIVNTKASLTRSYSSTSIKRSF